MKSSWILVPALLWLGCLLAWALSLTVSTPARADTFLCLTPGVCVSTTDYGKGRYRVHLNGEYGYAIIDCAANTVTVAPDNKPDTFVSPVQEGTVAAGLRDKTCGRGS